MVVLPLVVYAAWRLHVALNLDGGEFAIRPPSQWAIELIPHVLARMGLIASKKGVYFGIMIVAVVLGVRALRRPGSEFDRLAVIAASVFVLYNGFLLFAYIASFTTYDALHASSYWRYNLHLGGVCLAFAATGAALLWRRWLAPRLTAQAGTILSRGAIVLVVALPIALSHKVRFDTNSRYIYVRAVAKDMARILNPGTRLLVVDADNDGQYVVIMRYLLHGSARIVGEVTAFTRTTPEKLRKLVARQRASHVWIHQPVPVTVQTFGIQMKPGSSYLLAREQSGWSVAQSWPYGAAGRAKPGK
jgi:hypothetical protein